MEKVYTKFVHKNGTNIPIHSKGFLSRRSLLSKRLLLKTKVLSGIERSEDGRKAFVFGGVGAKPPTYITMSIRGKPWLASQPPPQSWGEGRVSQDI